MTREDIGDYIANGINEILVKYSVVFGDVSTVLDPIIRNAYIRDVGSCVSNDCIEEIANHLGTDDVSVISSMGRHIIANNVFSCDDLMNENVENYLKKKAERIFKKHGRVHILFKDYIQQEDKLKIELTEVGDGPMAV